MRRVRERILELDGLRGLAIFQVILFHYFYYFPEANYRPVGFIRNAFFWFERSIALGWTGVDLFFVLSGFLIGGILLGARDSPNYFKTFYLRRFFRIIPLYYAWIVLYITAAIVVRFEGADTSSRLYLLPLFLQNFGVVKYALPAFFWFAATWSLAVEEQFYLISPLVIRLLSRRWLYWFLGAVIFMAPLLRLIVRRIPYLGHDSAYVLMPCRADALAMGILAAMGWRNVGFRSWLAAHTSLLYGISGLFLAGVIAFGWYSPHMFSLPMQSLGYTWMAAFYTAVLLLALTVPTGPLAFIARTGWLRELGKISYCLYIIHEGIRYLCQAMFRFAGFGQSWQQIAANLPALLIVFLVARLSWKYFEHPLLLRGHEYRYFPR
jgi:peptidoglycan/LPS O-acetylase OafA/YrhL